MKFLYISLCCMVFLIFISTSQAHGVRANISSHGAIIVTAEYDDSEPLSYGKTEVYSPNNREIPFQTGRTDKNGRFAFFPDQKGTWEVVVSDGMGHRVSLTSDINKDFGMIEDIKMSQGTQKKYAFSKVLGVIAGVSFILGICGLVVLIKERHKNTLEN